MSYFTEIDAWLTAILLVDEEVDTSEEEWFDRVKSQIKAKLLESYRNGQKAGTNPEKPTREEPKAPEKRRFPFSRKPRRQ
jgi:hypothetical protein